MLTALRLQELTVHVFFSSIVSSFNLSIFIIQGLIMEDSKKAAKAFVDKYFPVRPQQQQPKFPDVLGDLFPESSKKKGYYSQSSSSGTTRTVPADGYSQGKAGKAPQKSGKAVVFCEVSEPCSMSSSVDYGCRDNYYYEKKDKKDGYDYPDPEHSRGEWWQGSLYY